MKLKAFKMICTLISFTLILAISMPVFAATDLSDVFENNDFLKQYEQEILIDVNKTIYTEFKDTAPEDDEIYNTYPLAKEDFDYDRIIKFYFDTNLLSENSLDETKINNILNSSECFYDISMSIKNQIVGFTFIKYFPLREDLKGKLDLETEKRIEELAGQWHATGIGISNYISNAEIYKNNVVRFLKNQETNYKKVYFISDFGENLPISVAMFVTEDSDIRFQILYGTVNNKRIDYENPDDTLYTFEEIKEIAAQYVPLPIGEDIEYSGLPSGVQTDNNKTTIIIAASAGVAILIAAVGSIILIKKKKAKASAELSE